MGARKHDADDAADVEVDPVLAAVLDDRGVHARVGQVLAFRVVSEDRRTIPVTGLPYFASFDDEDPELSSNAKTLVRAPVEDPDA